ncbi:Uncharacterised protein [Klebsiella pneumoniae]|nr:Uncharacterised protein [Klebsiella pneumoniae]SLY78675.1 Uncharacterised protein [Klebsiella pneumoniae]SLY86242.1 Uncharacterised protein [Klebsiella pneumoniae]SLZ05478.1 Uncharacterised protein [Klebsiella pneumoniae]SLZ35784.1 Uncharacterised protein [Klebsiella pneumoniae]
MDEYDIITSFRHAVIKSDRTNLLCMGMGFVE